MPHSRPPQTRHVLIVAHGAPADPEPQEAALQSLGHRVAEELPGWDVRGATLAAERRLEAALAGLDAPLVYPFFMAEGWFTGTALPRRLAAAGAQGARVLAPFGTDPALPALMVEAGRNAAAEAGIEAAGAALLIAAHGARGSRTAAATTLASVAALERMSGFARVLAGFIEEPPFLADAARRAARGVCLPFFALAAGHVVDDVPAALEQAGFEGPLLPPIGAHPGVPGLIAAALRAAAA
ncbi:MAG: cobalamin biosynthesis protein CbiX [Alphaproteobacteria bacterium HGW-Alphaproteobacteria-2]|nr:MAG: cobalamin biosynthesis protein CbiX [Alphaproteobacteria bacterium HGW-Alphaproteobacteria-2]